MERGPKFQSNIDGKQRLCLNSNYSRAPWTCLSSKSSGAARCTDSELPNEFNNSPRTCSASGKALFTRRSIVCRTGVGSNRNGDSRKTTAGQILFTHPVRAQTTGNGNLRLGADVRRDRANHAIGVKLL